MVSHIGRLPALPLGRGRRFLACLALLAFSLPAAPAQETTPGEAAYWVGPMKQVHARFTGTKGAFAQFGDSMTVSHAFWSRLRHGERRNLSPTLARAFARVEGYMRPECWDKWKGEDHGNGGPDLRWALANVDRWLSTLNPEVVLILFGSNDLIVLDAAEYEKLTRRLAQRCLDNGSVVILTTAPPRSGWADKSAQFAEAVRRVARELGTPLVDYHAEVLRRRPEDWDGTLAKFDGVEGNEYQAPTLISRDGVHPSNPLAHADYSEESLNRNGYALRTVLTLAVYADVIDQVLDTPWLGQVRQGQWGVQALAAAAVVGGMFVAVWLARGALRKAARRNPAS